MSLRTFVDEAGTEWHAFDVVPRKDERRNRERRAADASALPPVDRREAERRLTVGELTTLSTVNEGWLCFESDSERRRLSPIPPDWRTSSNSALSAYCRSARAVRPLS